MQIKTSFKLAALAGCLATTQAIKVDAAQNSVNIDIDFDVHVEPAETVNDSGNTSTQEGASEDIGTPTEEVAIDP